MPRPKEEISLSDLTKLSALKESVASRFRKRTKMPPALLLRRSLLALLDCGLVALSFYIALLLRMDG